MNSNFDRRSFFQMMIRISIAIFKKDPDRDLNFGYWANALSKSMLSDNVHRNKGKIFIMSVDIFRGNMYVLSSECIIDHTFMKYKFSFQ